MLQHRPGSVRAGAVQPPRQCREIRAAGLDRSGSGLGSTGDASDPADHGRGRRAFRRTSSSGSSTSSTGCARATGCAPAPGLGLSICRGFVEAMGGTIAAANRADRSGAVFTITMPVPADAARTWVESRMTTNAAYRSSSSMTSRRSASCCASASAPRATRSARRRNAPTGLRPNSSTRKSPT